MLDPMKVQHGDASSMAVFLSEDMELLLLYGGSKAIFVEASAALTFAS